MGPDLVLCCLADRRVERHLAQSEGDDAIGEREDLFEAVADQNDRYVLRRDLFDQLARRLGLAQAQGSVGSSKMTRRRPLIVARAIAIACRCPPEKRRTGLS